MGSVGAGKQSVEPAVVSSQVASVVGAVNSSRSAVPSSDVAPDARRAATAISASSATAAPATAAT